MGEAHWDTGNDMEELYLIGIRTVAPPYDVDLYAIVLYYETTRNQKNRPLTSGGRIVLFRDVALANRVLALGDVAFTKYFAAPQEIAVTYEPLKALALVENAEYDDSATIINCANEVLDFVAATGREMPHVYRTALESFLNYATFDRDLSVYFDRAAGGREAVRDALLWCFGAVWMSVRLFEDAAPKWL